MACRCRKIYPDQQARPQMPIASVEEPSQKKVTKRELAKGKDHWH